MAWGAWTGEWGAWTGEWGVWTREHGPGSGEHGPGSGEHGPGSGEYGLGSMDRGVGSMDRGAVIGIWYTAAEGCPVQSRILSYTNRITLEVNWLPTFSFHGDSLKNSSVHQQVYSYMHPKFPIKYIFT